MRWSKKESQPPQIICPASNEPCNYYTVCQAKQNMRDDGWRVLPPDFAENFPDMAKAMKEIVDIADNQTCITLAINGLCVIAEREGEHPETRRQATNLADKFIELRANHAHWERPL